MTQTGFNTQRQEYNVTLESTILQKKKKNIGKVDAWWTGGFNISCSAS